VAKARVSPSVGKFNTSCRPTSLNALSIDVLDADTTQADCAILLVARDTSLKADKYKELSTTQQFIEVINKMYVVSPGCHFCGNLVCMKLAGLKRHS
jgi:hypothetical protein